MRSTFRSALGSFAVAASLFQGYALSQTLATPNRPTARIVSAVDNSRRAILKGNTHPLARAEFDRGTVDPSLTIKHMLLVLKRSDEQEASLEALIEQQMDPASPNFHHWLSPQEFGQTYGPADSDVAQITSWLQQQGFSVDNVSTGRVTIEFSGTAGSVTTAFHTEIHNYIVNGALHFANASDPQIPEALTPVVLGVTSLHNFLPQAQSFKGQRVKRDAKTGVVTPVDETTEKPLPEFVRTNSSGNIKEDITPYDFATIYNLLPTWNAGINGAGQTIAIAGQSDITLADVQNFQSSFGLPNNPPIIVHSGSDPGFTDSQLENTLDVEWAGATAPGATITLVIASTAQLAASYIINNKTATIVSESYGECELNLGTAGNASYNNLWQQGAAEGISIFESAGDQGSAGCEDSSLRKLNPATTGLQVNGIASSPYVTAVGGTDLFWEEGSPSVYWNATASANGSTAIGYIPEIAWNPTCTSNFVIFEQKSAGAEADCNALAASSTQSNLVFITGGSGGVSACTTPNGTKPTNCSGGYAKPSWQSGTGVPNDSKRDLPDVSLFASAGYPGYPGSSYLICESATEPCVYSNSTDVVYQEVGGTSVSTPAMAGIMALIQQKLGSPQGLANPVLYQLAAAESLSTCNASTVSSGNTCVFYDTTLGTNTMPCTALSTNCNVTTVGDRYGILTGYNAGKGYDQATGLGSLNITNLVNAWAALAAPITFSVPNHTYGDAAFTLSATSNSSGAFTYAVVSGPATLSGTKLTITGAGTIIAKASQAAAGSFVASSVTSTFTVAQAASTITWKPSTTQISAGSPVGSGVLDATASQSGTITYTAATSGQTPVQITSSTVLTAGVYTVSATFQPTSANYTAETGNITLTVSSAVGSTPPAANPYIWIANPGGSMSEFNNGAAVRPLAISGGGIGAAVDSAANLWSINANGNVLTEMNKAGTVVSGNGYSGGGISGATALAIDGSGAVWLVNSSNSVSVFTNAGAAVTPSNGYTGGNMSAPNGIAVDISGSVWITNAGNNTVTEILGAAAPTSPLSTAVTNNTLGAKP